MENKVSNKNKNSINSMDLFLWILFAIVGIYVISMLFVMYFGLINSIKGTRDFNHGNFLGLPNIVDEKGHSVGYGWCFSNYVEIFKELSVNVIINQRNVPIGMFEMLFNSLLYSVLMSVFTIATQIMVAYAVSKYKFKGQGLLYNLAIIVMIIPIVGSLASEMQFAQSLGLNNSFIGICIMRCKYSGLYFLVFYAAFKSISWTYAEAAQIDGAGHWRTFLTIMLPMIGSTIGAVFVLQFIANFNDYYTPMIFLSQRPTMAYGLYRFKLEPKYMGQPPKVLAAAMLTCLPMVVIFLIFRNKIMGNVSVGGIKG